MIVKGFLRNIYIVIARCFITKNVIMKGVITMNSVACVEAFDINIRVDIDTRIIIARCSITYNVIMNNVICVIIFRKDTYTIIARYSIINIKISVFRIMNNRVVVNATVMF